MTTAPKPASQKDPEARVAYLIGRFLQKKCTRTEGHELDDWICASDDNLLLFEALTDSSFQEALVLNPALIEVLGRYYNNRQLKRLTHLQAKPGNF